MPVITEIARQKKNGARFSIKIDGSYAFSLGDLDLSASNLRVGADLSEPEVAEWQRISGEGKAYDRALNYIAIRRRSQAEVERYLERKDYDPEIAAGVVERLVKLGLLNDAEFAAAWIRERKLLRPRSTQALKFELVKLGVAREDIDTALTNEVGDEIETIIELIQRRQRQYPDREKLMAYLARQGFRYDQIKQAFSRIDET